MFANLHNPPLYVLVGETIERHGGGVKHTLTLRRWLGTGKVKAWNTCVLKSSKFDEGEEVHK